MRPFLVNGELFFLKKKWVKVWWIEMFALLLQCSKPQREAAKLSHPPRMRAISFLGKRCSLYLIDKKTPFPDNGHLHPCSMVVIASKNSHVGFEQQDRQVSFFYTSLLCSNQRIPPTPWLRG